MSFTQIIGKVFVPRQKALEKNKSYIRKRKEPKREMFFLLRLFMFQAVLLISQRKESYIPS